MEIDLLKDIFKEDILNMFKVYLLESLKVTNKTYVGKTEKHLYVRINEHNKGESRYTKAFKPWKLLYFENFSCEKCAENRELFLKSGIGYRFRKIIQANYTKLK